MKNLVFKLLICLFFYFPFVVNGQSWSIINYSDCPLTVTLTCGSISESSNTYSDNWYGMWDSTIVGNHSFGNIPCSCSDPTLRIVDNCDDQNVQLIQCPLSALNSSNDKWCCCNHTYPSCQDENNCFIITFNTGNCTITFSRPADCL